MKLHGHMCICLLLTLAMSILIPRPGLAQQGPGDSKGIALDAARRAAIIDSVNAALKDARVLPDESSRFLLEIVLDENGQSVKLISSENELDSDGDTEEKIMPKNLACWWEINAEEAKPLVEFYGEVFGWNHTYDDGSGIYYIDSGNGSNGGIGGGIFTGKGTLPTHRCLYIKVDDVDAIVRKVRARGQQILQGPYDLPSGTRLAFFRDPEGHMIGLIKPVRQQTD